MDGLKKDLVSADSLLRALLRPLNTALCSGYFGQGAFDFLKRLTSGTENNFKKVLTHSFLHVMIIELSRWWQQTEIKIIVDIRLKRCDNNLVGKTFCLNVPKKYLKKVLDKWFADDIIKKSQRAAYETDLWKLNKVSISKCAGLPVLKQEQQYLRSQFASKFWVTNYKLRVWSWLRTNAGGVPNTCKSNEAFFHRMLAFTERSLVANGWVTRRQPARKRGITLGNRC